MFLYLVCVLLLVSACISERAKEDEKAGKKEVNESVAESVPKATMICGLIMIVVELLLKERVY